MKTSIFLMAACFVSFGLAAKVHHSGGGHVSSNNHPISVHTTKDGTYVAHSHATSQDETRTNNYSEKRNVNPYTGKDGTR